MKYSNNVFYFSFLVILFFVSTLLLINVYKCELIKTTIKSNGAITLIDSTEFTNNLHEYLPKDRMAFYPVFYLGENSDTIYLGRESINPYSNIEYDCPSIKSLSLADSLKMKIRVDTMLAISYKQFYKTYSEKEKSLQIYSANLYQAYAIIVQNLSDSVFYIGSHNSIKYTIKQAQDEQGKWVDIETPTRYFCGTGARDILMEPRMIVIAKLIRSGGDFKTKCRLKFKLNSQVVYSNIFIDFIDRKQLVAPI